MGQLGETPPIIRSILPLVNWRTEAYLGDALESIRQQTHHSREVVLVDNASEGFDATEFASFQPFTLIPNRRNYGFAAANNQGIAETRGEFVMLLNCDARIDPDFTARALVAFRANPRIGIVVPKLLMADGSGRIDSAGHVMYTDRTAAHRGRGELDQGQYDRAGFCFGGTAAAVVYRRELIEQISSNGTLFDESFFAYYEDVDVDWRSALAGWHAYYEPRCIGHHVGHGSGGRADLRVQMLAEKNRYLMLLKNDAALSQLASFVPLFVYETWHLAKTLLKPWLWPAYLLLLWHAPRALLYRFTAQRELSAAEVAERFVQRGHQPPPPASPPAPAISMPFDRDVVVASSAGEVTRAEATAGDSTALVSAIVVNFNNVDLTRACIARLLVQTHRSIEIILVDNGSDVNEAEVLAAEFPQIRTLRLERNSGFTGGVNWGASLATGDYIALVNNDLLLDEHAIACMLAALERDEASAVSGRIVNVSGIADTQPVLALLRSAAGEGRADAAARESNYALELVESNANHGVSLYGYVVPALYGDAAGCFYPSGGLCLLRRSDLAGLLPELFPQRYFAYHEDTHLGFALRSRAKKIIKEPLAAGVHIEGSTARRIPAWRLRFYQERNRLLNILGFYPADVLWKLALPLLFTTCASTIAMLFKSPASYPGMCLAHMALTFSPLYVLRERRRRRNETLTDDSFWLAELSGQVRGQGGLLNKLSLAWCRLTRIPCRELR